MSRDEELTLGVVRLSCHLRNNIKQEYGKILGKLRKPFSWSRMNDMFCAIPCEAGCKKKSNKTSKHF